ncbi:peroxisomal coenzyme A diphosphatase NUDT7 [Arapaima gigas]
MDAVERIKAHIQKYDTRFNMCAPALTKASVLIPLFMKKGEIHVLMTLRSLKASLKSGAGEVCFPGGKYDPQDHDEIATALREAEEEIGLPPDKVDVVGKFVPVLSKSGVLITPVVACIDDAFQAQPNPEEVSDVFAVPLDYFLAPTNHSSFHLSWFPGSIHNFYYLDPHSNKEYHIWGLTALLAVIVSVLAYRRRPTFEVEFDPEDPLSYLQHSFQLGLSKL